MRSITSFVLRTQYSLVEPDTANPWKRQVSIKFVLVYLYFEMHEVVIWRAQVPMFWITKFKHSIELLQLNASIFIY